MGIETIRDHLTARKQKGKLHYFKICGSVEEKAH